MDVDTACEASGGILAFAALSQHLTSLKADNSGPSVEQRFGLRAARQELIKLRGAIDHIVKQPNDPSAQHEQPVDPTTQHVFSAVMNLGELAVSCLQEVDILLEELDRLISAVEGTGESDMPQYSDSWTSPLAQLTLRQDKVKLLSEAASREISTIISTRADGIRQTMQSLRIDTRRIRPEFESRVDSLSQSLSSLCDVLQRGSAKEGVRHEVSILSRQDVEEMRSILRHLTQAEDHMIAEKIVASLNYDSRPVRHDSVPQAHRDTFRWAFESRLAEWFRSGNSTFWISGKPGSGKSTFMKLISSHQQTKELLSAWAGSSDRLSTAAHFFWIAGTSIQKSWQGLFQSLLFDTFNKQPAVIRLICPRRWAAAQQGKWQEAAEPWSVTELGVALRALATAPDFPLKLCFFVDGLDEYDSDHEELCNILHDMARSPHIKMCLSSRPWPVFEQRFGTDPAKRMDIHKLTRDDIRKFVHDQLQLSSESNAGIPEGERENLCQEIAAKADGVFLWAFFVTKTLREAVSLGETFSDLRRRLDRLPRDLEQLFRTMLDSVDVPSHPKMAGILQAASHALEPLHIDLYAVLEKEFDTHNYARSCQIQAMVPVQLSAQRGQTARSVNDKTKGLLKLVDQRFEFLHRTVKDFVLTRDMGEYLKEKLPNNHNGYKAIATAYLGFLKTTNLDSSVVAGIVKLGQGRNSGVFTSHLNRALIYTSEALKSDQSPNAMTLLDDYDHAVERMIRIGHVSVRGIVAPGSDPKLLFREEILRHNLSQYIEQRLRDNPDFLELLENPPLYFALMPMSLSSGESPAPVPGILEMLLRSGQDPNSTTDMVPADVQSSGSSLPTPWVLFARETMSVFNMLSVACTFPAMRFNDSLNEDIFVSLLSHGADPNVSLLPERPRGSHTAFSHFLDISTSQFLGTECYDGYLKTLRAFLRAGASLGIPTYGKAVDGSSIHIDIGSGQQEEAFGNLAREQPAESVLTSYCALLKTLFSSLAADPQRAKFTQSVVTELISHSSGEEWYLQEISSSLSESCPDPMRGELQFMIDHALLTRRSLKRDRGSWDESSFANAAKVTKH